LTIALILTNGNDGHVLQSLGWNKKENWGAKDKELVNQFYKKRDADSLSIQRIKQSCAKRISLAIHMLKNAIKTGFEPAYVLADSWFMWETSFSKIQNNKLRFLIKLYVIGQMKTNKCIIISGKHKMAILVPDYKQKDIIWCKKYKCN